MALQIVKSYISNNRCYKNGVKRTPIGIQIHSIGTAQGTAKAVVDYWNSASVSAATTYICDADVAGRAYQMLPEEYYSWADGGYGNRNLITIEIAESDWMRYTSGANYTVTNDKLFKEDILRGYDTAVLLCADICKRYGWDPTKKLPSGLYLISSHDEGRIAGLSTSHVDPSHIWPKFNLSMDTFRRAVKNALSGKAVTTTNDEYETTVSYYRVRKTWKDAASQLGAYTILANAKAACPVGYSVFDDKGKVVYTNKAPAVTTKGTQASDFVGLSEGKAAEKILEMIHKCDDSGILYSVTAAQMILESGYVTTALVRSGNNAFGMKANLSGNTWVSVWDGENTVTIPTKEWSSSGGWVTINDVFRKYGCLEDSIKDHSLYLLGAKNGSKLRYDGITSCKDYISAAKLIKSGGYATDPSYVDKLKSIVQRFSLDRYDAELLSEKEPEMNATVKKAVDWALAVAKDNSHGYNNAKGKRTGNPDYACSSFLAAAWRAAGLTTIPADAYTATMRKYFLEAGFVDISDKVDLKTGKGMIAGDVVLLPGKHVEMVINSKHQLVGARGNAFNGAENGKAGDQTGDEIAVANWFDYGWRFCLRYSKEEKKEPVYRVQLGFYKVKANATKKVNSLPDLKLTTIERNGGYSVVTKTTYKTASGAKTAANNIKKKGYDAIVIEVI